MGLTDIDSVRVVCICSNEDVVTFEGHPTAEYVLRCRGGVVKGLQQIAAQVERQRGRQFGSE